MNRRLPSWRLLGITTALALAASVAMALATPATITVDGQRISTDVAPVTTPGGAYLPLRAISDAAGAEVHYDKKSAAVVVRRAGHTLAMRLGSRNAILDGHRVTLVHAPFTVRGRTMVAAPTLAHAFGSTVRFDRRRDVVDVRTPGVVVAPVLDDDAP